ncbi:unnamed protein product [Schistosoma mattheei]|uniref:ATM interactor n=1 Tax=Schistosoma mattheei TaxID=31246 RepID=A0AA85C2W0_9TREM|nr:unnamed protein product [Schistosoma mattheei]
MIMGTCEVYRSFPSESKDNDQKVNNFPIRESSVLHVVISESELTELPLPTYVCELCGIKVKTKANLRAHQIKTHKIMKNAKDVAFYSKQRYNVSYIYHCPVATCKHNIGLGGGFSTYWRLKQHYQHVHMQKSYQCNKCKHFFPTPSYHAYHQKLCGATYSCSVCFRSYSSKKHLLQHYRRSGHSNTLSLNSIPKVENTPNRSPSKNTSIPSSYVARNPIPPSGSCGPLVLPLLILPVTVPNVSDVNVENLNSNVLGCLNMNFLYTSALSALRTLSTQIFPNPNVQVNLSESAINSSDTSVVLKPDLGNFCNLYAVPVSNSSLEASTQTEQLYTPITVSQPCSHTLQTHELVSVNTCTDEDDISSFIGGLFCNAAVEANLPHSSTVYDNYEVRQERKLSYETKQITLGPLNEHHPCSSLKPTKNSVQSSDYISLTGCSNNGVDQEIQARLLPLRENAAMQTDVMENLNAEIATHYPHSDHSTYFTPSRMLETPPPPMLQSTVSLGTHLSTACQTLHRLLNEAKISDNQSPLMEILNMDTTTDSGTRACVNVINYSGYDLPGSTDPMLQCSSTSIKNSVQTNTVPTSCDNSQYCNLNTVETTTQHDWSANVDFTHNQTQTIDEDIELWLNSVETQTNLALFDPSFFSDICVGVDDDFLQS